MFKIVDGREYFYQWDLDRQVAVEDASITEVHFCNRTDECSLVVDVVDGVANVPNAILQYSFDVRVFGYDGKATLHEKTFKVKPRSKPADYVYVETEVRKFDDLFAKAEEAINTAEESATQVETTANELYEFVEGHQLDFVDDGEGNVELKAIEIEDGELTPGALRNYYTKTETDERIEEAVGAIEIPETDLTGYAKLEDIPTVPSNVSAFTNDAGYLTEHQSLDEYAKKSELFSGDYNELTNKPTIPSIEGLATEDYVDTEMGKTRVWVNTKNFATKQELATEVDNLTTEFGNVLADYATTKYVGEAIQTALSGIAQAEGGAY